MEIVKIGYYTLNTLDSQFGTLPIEEGILVQRDGMDLARIEPENDLLARLVILPTVHLEHKGLFHTQDFDLIVAAGVKMLEAILDAKESKSQKEN